MQIKEIPAASPNLNLPQAKRKTGDFIEAFIDLCKDMPSPRLFAKWAAISCIAGVLERKVWLDTFKRLYPNIYVLIVGPPAVGKTVTIDIASAFWESIPELHIAPTSLSRASFNDALADATRTATITGVTTGLELFNHLNVYSPELAVLLPQYDLDFLGALTNIYDNGAFKEHKRGNKLKIEIKQPSVNLIACTTPAQLHTFLPPAAWEQGFMSRTLIVYSGEVIKKPIFAMRKGFIERFNLLKQDLELIFRMNGSFKVEDEVAEAINNWHLNGGNPRPEHPKLVGYVGRRTAHLLKLCMIFSAARSSAKIISMEDYNNVMNTLVETEAFMPEALLAISGASGENTVIDEAYQFVVRTFTKENAGKTKDFKYIPEYRLLAFIRSRAPIHAVIPTLNMMVQMKLIKEGIDTQGQRVFAPGDKQQI